MSSLDEQFSEQFYRWELRGRGWQVFDEPIVLGPPFRPFLGHSVPAALHVDDGRRPTAISAFIERLGRRDRREEEKPFKVEEPLPSLRRVEQLNELQLTLPSSRAASDSEVGTLIHHICRAGDPLALEILGTAKEIVPQFVAPPSAKARLERALNANFPAVSITPATNVLPRVWSESDALFTVVELGLGMEFMIPLGDADADLLGGMVSALDTLSQAELGLCQILFEPLQDPWRESILAAVTTDEGAPLFVNRPELVRGAQQKTASPLFAVVIRLAASAADYRRCWEIVTDMAAGLSALSRAGSNYLVPLDNKKYPAKAHEEDILNRQSRRSGMILNLEELSQFLTLPTSAVSSRLRRENVKTRPAPHQSAQLGSLLLGVNRHAGITREVRLTPDQRVRHTHIIGASGTGKSTLLLNLIRQDIENGQGVAVLDPHGDLVDQILGTIPAERIGDVILIDPSDEEYSVGFNILAAHSEFEKTLIASDLVGVFQRLSTSWGDQMSTVLRNAILAFLESTEGGTLADLRRFLLEPSYRTRFLATVQDHEIAYYWEKAFPQLSGGKSVGPVVTRLDEFLSRKPIRYMVSQKENRIHFAEVLDKGRIFLAKLSQGEIGKENSFLLGSLLLSKIQQTAMSRQRIRESERRDFWCYVDEFHSFISPSMAEILTGARKYRVGLTLAHQELRQVQASPEVAGALLSNAYTRIAFRLGDADARTLASAFTHFEPGDFQNLETGQAICRIEKSDFDFNLAVRSLAESPISPEIRRQEVIAASRRKYGRTRSDIETLLLRQRQAEVATPTVPAKAGKDSPLAKPLKAASVPTGAAPGSVEFPPLPSYGATSERESQIEAPPSESPAPPRCAPVAASPSPADEPPTTDSASPQAESVPPPPRDLGRGGAQHQAIQKRVKEAAEALGFRATLEKEILQGRGSVDVFLERGPHVIACEISVTTTIDHEVGNVSKCFKAKLPAIAVVSTDEERLAKIEAAVTHSLGQEDASRTRYYLPDEFIEHLRSVPSASSAPAANEEIRRGYKVKRNIVSLSDGERAAREEAALRLIGERLRHSPDA